MMSRFLLRTVLLLAIASTCVERLPANALTSQAMDNPIPVVTVSAASFEAASLAPDSIAAAFGTQLATQTLIATTLPLPTELGGTSVEVNGRRAGLFFVSPFQINYLLPTESESGNLSVMIRSSDGVITRGSVEVNRIAPAIFTANQNGLGVPAALLVRVAGDGAQTLESVAQPHPANGLQTTRPLDLGPEGERVFLVLFLSGISRAADPDGDGNKRETVRVIIGGEESQPLFAGLQGNFAGLDQINLELPRRLIARGRVSLAVTGTNFAASNLVEIEISGRAGDLPPRIDSFSTGSILAGQVMHINGAGFAPNPGQNQVRISGLEARVGAATSARLAVVVPYGAETGPISVRTLQGEATSGSQLPVRTSISGFVESTSRLPLAHVLVRLAGTGLTAMTNGEGFFQLGDVPQGPAVIEVDGATAQASPPYPRILLGLQVQANRDNLLPRPIALQQATGQQISIFSQSSMGGTAIRVSAVADSFASSAAKETAQTSEIQLELPQNLVARFPDGSTSGTVTLTIIESGRAPVALPFGQFNPQIAQLSPFGVTFTPGARLAFPNTEGFPVETQLKLYRLDQRTGSPTLGRFIESGQATVIDTGNGTRIQTEVNAITEGGCYFIALPRPTTTVIGRVVGGDGITPVRQAFVRARGQEAVTDGQGGFILRHVPVGIGELLSLDASYLRADGRIDRVERRSIPIVAGGITLVSPELVLPLGESNRPPVIVAPSSLRMNSNEIRHISIVAADPDIGQTLQLAVSGAEFATIIPGENDVYYLRLAPRITDHGRFTLTLAATDSLGLGASQEIMLEINRPPVAQPQSAMTDEDKPVTVTLEGSDPDGHVGSALSFIIVSHPARGSLSGLTPVGPDRLSLTYTPAPDYHGSDSFSFKVSDGMGESESATVSLAVRSINDPPVISVPERQVLFTDELLSFSVSAFDADNDQSLAISATGLPGGADLTQNMANSAQFRWTPQASQHGSYTVSFKVTDSDSPALSDSAEVTIRVLARWSPTAPLEGGHVTGFLSDGADLYAGTSGGGVFRSPDGGQNWIQVGGGLPNSMHVSSLASISGKLFVAGCGFYVSNDHGQRWTSRSQNLNSCVNALLASETALFAASWGVGVYRTNDEGQNWMLSSAGLSDLSLTSLATSGGSLFVGTNSGQVFRSGDQGVSWAPASAGLPANSYVASLASIGGNLFAGTGQGIYLSDNQGQSWRQVFSLNGGIGPMTVDGTSLIAVTCCGIYRTINQGQSWTQLASDGLPNIGLGAIHVHNGKTYFGSYGRGVYRLSDDGQRLTLMSSGMTAARVRAAAGSGANILVGTEGGGLYRSADLGRTWTPANISSNVSYVWTLVTNGNDLLAGTNDGVYISSNQGQSWRASVSGINGYNVSSIVVSGQTILAGTFGSGVFRSTNSGLDWAEVNTGLTSSNINALALSGGRVFAGTSDGMFVTSNQGQSWAPLSAGLSSTSVSSFALIGNTLFAGTRGGGLHRLEASGQSWAPLDSSFIGNHIETLLATSEGLYLGHGGGVYFSDDEGQSWIRITAGLSNQNVATLGASSTHLLAGTYGGGAFVRPR